MKPINLHCSKNVLIPKAWYIYSLPAQFPLFVSAAWNMPFEDKVSLTQYFMSSAFESKVLFILLYSSYQPNKKLTYMAMLGACFDLLYILFVMIRTGYKGKAYSHSYPCWYFSYLSFRSRFSSVCALLVRWMARTLALKASIVTIRIPVPFYPICSLFPLNQ